MNTGKKWQFNLITELTDKGAISGPFSQMFIGEKMSDALNEALIGIAHIDFISSRYYQHKEPDGLTGYGHMLIMMPSCAVFCVDGGDICWNIALISNRGETLTKDLGGYLNTPFLLSLDDKEMDEMMQDALVYKEEHRMKLKEQLVKLPQHG